MDCFLRACRVKFYRILGGERIIKLKKTVEFYYIKVPKMYLLSFATKLL